MQENTASNLITWGERKRQSYTLAADYAMRGDWEAFCDIVRGRHEIMVQCFQAFYNHMPDALKRDFALFCYSRHGYNYSIIREAVISLPKNGQKELPPAYAALPEITIYRAGNESIDHSHNELSWTLDLKVAESFIKHRSRPKKHLYRGTIEPENIIAYMDDRQENEIIQFRSVHSIAELK